MEIRASGKRVTGNNREVGGQNGIRQLEATRKYRPAHIGDAIRNEDAGQARAVMKRKVSDIGHAVRNGDTCYVGLIDERVTRNVDDRESVGSGRDDDISAGAIVARDGYRVVVSGENELRLRRSGASHREDCDNDSRSQSDAMATSPRQILSHRKITFWVVSDFMAHSPTHQSFSPRRINRVFFSFCILHY